MRQNNTQRVAVDIGGTFVDAIAFNRDTGEVNLEKAETTPEQPSNGVLNSIDKVNVNLSDTEAFVHGTTLGLNAVLERDGARTGIITNEGFSDVYEIARTNLERDSMYDINYQKPESMVPRRRRLGVPGRLNSDGSVVEEIDEGAVEDAATELVEDHGVDSIAICFLHSYQNDQHEQTAADVVRDAYPDVSVSVSSDITGEYREYERTSTAVLDGYIKPIFENYVDTLDAALADEGFDESFFITRSGGGTLTAESAKAAPVNTILSGPAGGLIGASHVGDVTGRNDLITVDMGGTSLDAAVIEDGSPVVKYDSTLEHQPMLIPVYDIRTIGAGGGSIAWLDGDLLKVGPESAGADPGPICYNNGGTEPTVTDAALALGFLDPADFLGGEMDTAEQAAIDGIKSQLANPLDTTVEGASSGVLDVALANTVGAIREITVEKGLDPRDFSMVAYGGAGPMFVPLVARELGVDEVLVPQAPSVFSAWGMLMADVVYDFSQTHIAVLSDVDLDMLNEAFTDLEADGRDTLSSEGISEDRQTLERTVEMRYHGQEHTVEVNADGIEDLDELADRFETQHKTRHGHTMDDPVQVVHLRVRAIGENDKPSLDRQEASDGTLQPSDTREAYCFAEDGFREFDVYERAILAPGDELEGPAVVTEPTTSLVFHSDQSATIDEYGHIIITTEDEQ
ncbi:methylhydantoinase [Halorubrum persicum]|uniref:Methylhydantoinase n=1 Tax=Halorubrum persicum TaxID=1383844 RepID=A0A2G1WFW7_9EURY|nr:hydantoinase/oxoprolinase family protein [Halorubrum persicum]PHQ37881.1 methylhydantoinase [Halorubrum persicum]